MGARIYWGQHYHLMEDFELGARLLTYGGILLISGGVIIDYIQKRQVGELMIMMMMMSK